MGKWWKGLRYALALLAVVSLVGGLVAYALGYDRWSDAGFIAALVAGFITLGWTALNAMASPAE